MRILPLIAATATAATLALSAQADPGKGKGKGHGKHRIHDNHIAAGCPPGLAKKNPPCIPPGQAKKYGRYGIGDIIYDDYRIIRNYDRYGLPRRGTFYRVGNNIYRVDRDTRKVLEFIGAVSNLLN